MELINKQYALASAVSGIVRTDENGEKWIRTRDVRESIMDAPTVEAEPTLSELAQCCEKRELVLVERTLFEEMKTVWCERTGNNENYY